MMLEHANCVHTISDVMIRLQSKGTELTLRYFSSLTQSSGTEADGKIIGYITNLGCHQGGP